MSIIAEATEVVRYRGLIRQLATRDLKLRYERNVLGFLWSLLNPLLMIVIYTFVFSMVLNAGIQRFPMYLVPVMLPWNFLVRCMLGVSPLIYQSGYLLNRAAFPSESIILGGLLSAFVDFCLEMVVFIIVIAALGADLLPGILFVPIAMVIHVIFVTGITFFFAVGYVFYRDTQYLTNILSTAWFFMTPIFYQVASIPAQYQALYSLNPMVHIAAIFREPLYSNTIPSVETYITASATAIGTFLLGWLVFNKYKREFAELL